MQTQETAEFPALQGISAALIERSQSVNLITELSDEDLNTIAADVVNGYEIDVESQSEWKSRMDKALAHASMARTENAYPFGHKSANIKFPLITSAAMQYNARAYPAIVRDQIVQCKVQGEDPSGKKAARAERVSNYMSSTFLTRIRGWDAQTDRLTLLLPVVGHLFRKRWYDASQDRIRMAIKLPCRDIIVNEGVPCLEDAPRITEELRLYPYEIESRVRMGVFQRHNFMRDTDDPHVAVEYLEQHARMDLDGDGYEEPYIFTLHKESNKIVRVVTGFGPDDIQETLDGTQVAHIEQELHYTSYTFAESLDGGFLGTGLGLLLGDTSETINTIMNQILDAGHLSSLGAGFIGARNFKLRGGPVRVNPGEFKQVNATGSDIREGIVQLRFPEPSPVLFQMLGMMIEMGREIAGVKDIMTGDAPRQQTATTTLALIEQGQMVFTATYKRIYRSLKEEFKAAAALMLKYGDADRYQAFFDSEEANLQADFDLDDLDITPVADPKSVTNMQEMARAEVLMQMAAQGVVDPQEATRRALKAAAFSDIDSLLPEQQPDPVQQEMVQLDLAKRRVDIEVQMADVQAKLARASRDMAEAETEEYTRGMGQALDQLKAMKEVIDVRQRQLGGLAGAPGNGGDFASPFDGGGGQPRGGVPVILGG
mgnify:CR=1 FL=1